MSATLSHEEIVAELHARHDARHSEPDVELIEAGQVRNFLLALDEPADHVGPGAVVPPLFLGTLGRTRRPDRTQTTDSAVNAGHEYDFFLPVHVGDTITTAREIVSIEVKQGKRGPMYLVRTRSTHTNQHGELVAELHWNTMRWGF